MKSSRLKLVFAAAVALSALAVPATAQVAASTEWANRQVPIELFGQFPNLQGADISPGGTAIAAKIRAGGVQALAIWPIDTPNAKPEIISRDADFDQEKVGAREIIGWDWMDDDTLIIVIRSRDNYMGNWYDNTRAAAYNRKTKKVVPLGWDRAIASAGTILWRSPPDAPVRRLLLQRQAGSGLAGATRGGGTLSERLNPEVIDVDVATGQYKVVQSSTRGVSSWAADGAGVVRFGSSFDRETGKVQILYRPDSESQFKTIVREKADMHSDVIVPSILLAGSGKAYATSNHEGYRALYEYDLAKLELGKKVFGVPGYDINGASTTIDGTALQAYGWTDQRARQRFVEPRLREVHAVLEEMFGKGNVWIGSADHKREKIIFTASELGQVPTTYLFNTTTGKVQRLAWANDQLKDAKLNPVSVVRYPASDGKQIEAVLTMPRHKAGAKNLPVIVLPHGGPWARDDADWDPFQWAQALAEWGYVVIQPNYRGSSGYGKEWQAASDGNWGHRMQDDLNDALAWLAGQGIADPKRACMMGWSYGGYAASRAAQRDGKLYRCAISGAGVHDLPAMVAYDKDYLGPYQAKLALGAAGALREVSPGLNAKDYSIPILIVHGERDIRVPVAQSRSLVSRLKAAGKREGTDFVYLEQPLNTHNLPREEDRVELLKTVKKFLDQHNPA